VVGDLHGTFSLLAQALSHVQFDPTVDRLFSVGDLIDRGPCSSAVLGYLRQPWFFAVRGNHEEMLLHCYAGGVCNERMLAENVEKHGLAWWLDTTEDEKVNILVALSELPLAMEVDTARGCVGLVHADVPEGQSWPTFVERLEAGHSSARMYALWSRERVERKDHQGVPGIDRVYVGHTPQPGVRCLGNVWMIDTGAVYGSIGRSGHAELSLLELMAAPEVVRKPEMLPRIAIYR
jgi:serine/threonine protein phosphatase 1